MAGQGRSDEAASVYEAALERRPDFFKPLNNLANLARQKGELERAQQLYERALAVEPNSFRAHTNLGTTLEALGDFERALMSYRRAVDIEPSAHAARLKLGEALVKTGKYRDALDAFSGAATAGAPPIAVLGGLVAAARRLSSTASIDDLHSTLPVSLRHHVLGILSLDAGRLADARAFLEQGLAQLPLPLAQAALGDTLRQLGGERAGMDLIQQAFDQAPADAEVAVLLGRARIERGEVDVGARVLAQLVETGTDSQTHARLVDTIVRLELPVAAAVEERRRWAAQHADWLTALVPPAKVLTPAERDAQAERPLRLGFVIGRLDRALVAPLAGALAKGPNQVVVYADSSFVHDGVSVVNTSQMSDRELSKRIAEDHIDVAIDLTGHGVGSRLLALARRPARLQLSYMDAGPRWLRALDAHICDEHARAMAEGDDVLVVPNVPWCWDATDLPAVVESKRSDVCFAANVELADVSSSVLDAWAAILGEMATSRFIVDAPGLEQADVAAVLRGQLQRRGIDSDRFTMRGRETDRSARLRGYADVDVVLDSFPCNALATTCEALAMGVPVVTWAGDRHCSQRGASMLHAVGLADLVGGDAKTYIAAAVSVAKDSSRRKKLRHGLRDRLLSGALGDPSQAACAFNEAVRRAWRTACAETALEPRRFDALTMSSPIGLDDLVVWGPQAEDSITSYVLREQARWFEDEVDFVPQLVSPGDGVLDVGANHGVYALPLAQAVGRNGRVWAFEPAPVTAALLRASAEANRLAQLEVVPAALASTVGRTSFFVSPHAELNAIGTEVDNPQGERIDVAVDTLDHLLPTLLPPLGRRGISFVKLDAEGAEVDIVRGGAAFLREQRPVLMVELQHGNRVNTGLLKALRQRSFAPFRLVPGLGVLVPYDEGSLIRPLNVFACPPNRVAELAKARRLVRTLPTLQEHERSLSLSQVIASFGRASSADLDAEERVRALWSAINSASTLCASSGTEQTLAFVRLLIAWGDRSRAAAVSSALLSQGRLGDVDERPPLSPTAAFDSIKCPSGQEGAWAESATLASLELVGGWSSYYHPTATIHRVDRMEQLGFAPPWALRRRTLARQLIPVLQRARRG